MDVVMGGLSWYQVKNLLDLGLTVGAEIGGHESNCAWDDYGVLINTTTKEDVVLSKELLEYKGWYLVSTPKFRDLVSPVTISAGSVIPFDGGMIHVKRTFNLDVNFSYSYKGFRVRLDILDDMFERFSMPVARSREIIGHQALEYIKAVASIDVSSLEEAAYDWMQEHLCIVTDSQEDADDSEIGLEHDKVLSKLEEFLGGPDAVTEEATSWYHAEYQLVLHRLY
jgi:hypothetical protein